MVSRLEKLPVSHDPALPIVDLETSTPLKICQSVADNFLNFARVINETYNNPLDITEFFELDLITETRDITISYYTSENYLFLTISPSDSMPTFYLSGIEKDGHFIVTALTELRDEKQRHIPLNEKTILSDSISLLGEMYNDIILTTQAITLEARHASVDIEDSVPLFDNLGRPTNRAIQTITRQQTIDYLIQQIAPESSGAQA